jgi:broad specificity phosphatase PhoE
MYLALHGQTEWNVERRVQGGWTWRIAIWNDHAHLADL